MKKLYLNKTKVHRKIYIFEDISNRQMLTYKNDYLLLDKASEPKDYVTLKDLTNRDSIFLKDNILNLYSALVKKKDFERKKDQFNIFFRRIPYISGKNVTIDFLKSLNKIYSKKNHYIKFREEIATYCNLKTRIPPIQFNNWIKKEEIPFIAIRVLASNFDNELEIMSHLFLKCDRISGISTSGFLPPLTLNGCLNDLNVYFIGAAFGDGGFQKEVSWTLVDGTSEKEKLFYSERYIKFIEDILRKIYNVKVFYILKSGNKVILNVPNKFFCRFINFFYDLPFSYKGERLQRPKIFDYNLRQNEYLFWRGLSDTDGSFRNSTKTFTIGMKQKKLLKEFSEFLRKGDISHSQRGQHLNVHTNSLDKLAKVIGSSHHRKREILLRQLKEGPSHQVLIGLNKSNLMSTYFNLLRIPDIRLYTGDLFDEVFRNTSISQIMKKTNVSRQTVHNWKNNITAMPIKLIKGLYEGDIFDLLSKHNCKFTVGKKGSNKAYLPIRLTDKIRFFASCVRPTKRGLYLNIRGNPKTINYKKQIENFFKIKFHYISSKEYRCDSLIMKIFFKTFFIYGQPWKAYSKKEVKRLKSNWSIT